MTGAVASIGFVGLGRAGWDMASNLVAAGYRLAVIEQDGARQGAFAEAHPGVAQGPEAFADVDLVVTMLPHGGVVRSVLLDEGGLASRLAPGTIVIDTSSSDPLGTRELGADLAAAGLVLLDAPVTRPVHDHVDTRRITFMVGGDDDTAVDRALPVLEAMAERVVRVGALGNGHATKTLNNYVACSGLVAALDALMIGQRYGLDAETTLDVFNAGTARNFSTASVLIDESLSRRYATGFGLALMVKDMGIATRLSEATGFPTSGPAEVHDRLARALEDMSDPAADHAAVIEHWERLNGERLPPLRPGRTLPPLS